MAAFPFGRAVQRGNDESWGASQERMLADAKEWLQRRLSLLQQLSTEYSQSYGEAALQDWLKTLDSLGYEPGWLTKTLQEARQMSPASTDPE